MQRQTQIKTLERRVTNLELEAQEATEKARKSLEEQTKLVGEKNALINTVKKLNRDIAKACDRPCSLFTLAGLMTAPVRFAARQFQAEPLADPAGRR